MYMYCLYIHSNLWANYYVATSPPTPPHPSLCCAINSHSFFSQSTHFVLPIRILLKEGRCISLILGLYLLITLLSNSALVRSTCVCLWFLIVGSVWVISVAGLWLLSVSVRRIEGVGSLVSVCFYVLFDIYEAASFNDLLFAQLAFILNFRCEAILFVSLTSLNHRGKSRTFLHSFTCMFGAFVVYVVWSAVW